MYKGDIRLGDTLDLKFTTRSFTTGVPTTLAGTPVISAYVGNGTTEITAGITLTVDFDGRAGLHNVRVVASSGNGFATATNIDLVVTTGTVGGVSVVGECVASFSIENRSALMPTVAARTYDVTATGGGGVDWGNVENATTTVNLTGTNIATNQVVASVSGAVGSVAAGGITAASIADGSIDRATFAVDTGLQSSRSNTAQAGGATSITLDASASSTTDFYKGMIVYLTGATGVGQGRLITAYNGATKVATVSPAWATNPDVTSTFAIMWAGGVDVQSWFGTVVATPATAGIPDINVKNIDNDAASASGTVTFPNATLASTTNITAGTLTTVTTATNVTTVNGLAAGVITATSIAADAITAAKIADAAIDTATFAAGTTIPRCTLVDTLTTYTGNTVQTGDSFARIGATGSGLTSLAPSATALSTATWTGTLATNLGTTNTTVATNLNATVTSRLAPTTAGRTLDVTATGAAGIDWGNVENQGTVVGLSSTSISYCTTVTVTQLIAGIRDANSNEFNIAPPVDGQVYNLETVGAYATGKTPLQPTVAGRTLDVTATGGAGIDWGNVENPTTILNLSGTTIKAVTDAITGGTDLTSILGTVITEGAAGRLAGAFSTLLNVATPVLTAASVNQTGDSFSRIGATGSGLSSLAPSATALSTAVWTGTLATNLGTSNTTIATNLNTTISSRASQVAVDDLPTNAEFAAAIALLSTSAQMVKALAATYDTATGSGGNVLTLSNGATQTINLSTGTRTTVG